MNPRRRRHNRQRRKDRKALREFEAMLSNERYVYYMELHNELFVAKGANIILLGDDNEVENSILQQPSFDNDN